MFFFSGNSRVHLFEYPYHLFQMTYGHSSLNISLKSSLYFHLNSLNFFFKFWLITTLVISSQRLRLSSYQRFENSGKWGGLRNRSVRYSFPANGWKKGLSSAFPLPHHFAGDLQGDTFSITFTTFLFWGDLPWDGSLKFNFLLEPFD